MNHKGYTIKPHAPFPSLYVVVTQGQGGSIPKVLESYFTTTTAAIDAIDKYLASPSENRSERKTNPKK